MILILVDRKNETQLCCIFRGTSLRTGDTSKSHARLSGRINASSTMRPSYASCWNILNQTTAHGLSAALDEKPYYVATVGLRESRKDSKRKYSQKPAPTASQAIRGRECGDRTLQPAESKSNMLPSELLIALRKICASLAQLSRFTLKLSGPSPFTTEHRPSKFSCYYPPFSIQACRLLDVLAERARVVCRRSADCWSPAACRAPPDKSQAFGQCVCREADSCVTTHQCGQQPDVRESSMK